MFSNQRLHGESRAVLGKVSAELTLGNTGTSRSSAHWPRGRGPAPQRTRAPALAAFPTPPPRAEPRRPRGLSAPRAGKGGFSPFPSPAPRELRPNATGVSRGPPTRVVGQACGAWSPGLAPGSRAASSHVGTARGRCREARHAARRLSPAGPGRAWLPPGRTRGQYLRGRGRGARPAAAGNTGTTLSWPAAAPASTSLFAAARGSPSARPRPGSPRPRLRPLGGSRGPAELQQQLYWERSTCGDGAGACSHGNGRRLAAGSPPSAGV